MIELFLMLIILTILFWVGFHITGALLTALIWLCIKLPLALIIMCLGLVFCVTILLIPLGGKCFKFALDILT